jgi:hypothetical protein
MGHFRFLTKISLAGDSKSTLLGILIVGVYITWNFNCRSFLAVFTIDIFFS